MSKGTAIGDITLPVEVSGGHDKRWIRVVQQTEQAMSENGGSIGRELTGVGCDRIAALELAMSKAAEEVEIARDALECSKAALVTARLLRKEVLGDLKQEKEKGVAFSSVVVILEDKIKIATLEVEIARECWETDRTSLNDAAKISQTMNPLLDVEKIEASNARIAAEREKCAQMVALVFKKFLLERQVQVTGSKNTFQSALSLEDGWTLITNHCPPPITSTEVMNWIAAGIQAMVASLNSVDAQVVWTTQLRLLDEHMETLRDEGNSALLNFGVVKTRLFECLTKDKEFKVFLDMVATRDNAGFTKVSYSSRKSKGDKSGSQSPGMGMFDSPGPSIGSGGPAQNLNSSFEPDPVAECSHIWTVYGALVKEYTQNFTHKTPGKPVQVKKVLVKELQERAASGENPQKMSKGVALTILKLVERAVESDNEGILVCSLCPGQVHNHGSCPRIKDCVVAASKVWAYLPCDRRKCKRGAGCYKNHNPVVAIEEAIKDQGLAEPLGEKVDSARKLDFIFSTFPAKVESGEPVVATAEEKVLVVPAKIESAELVAALVEEVKEVSGTLETTIVPAVPEQQRKGQPNKAGKAQLDSGSDGHVWMQERASELMEVVPHIGQMQLADGLRADITAKGKHPLLNGVVYVGNVVDCIVSLHALEEQGFMYAYVHGARNRRVLTDRLGVPVPGLDVTIVDRVAWLSMDSKVEISKERVRVLTVTDINTRENKFATCIDSDRHSTADKNSMGPVMQERRRQNRATRVDTESTVVEPTLEEQVRTVTFEKKGLSRAPNLKKTKKKKKKKKKENVTIPNTPITPTPVPIPVTPEKTPPSKPFNPVTPSAQEQASVLEQVNADLKRTESGEPVGKPMHVNRMTRLWSSTERPPVLFMVALLHMAFGHCGEARLIQMVKNQTMDHWPKEVTESAIRKYFPTCLACIQGRAATPGKDTKTKGTLIAECRLPVPDEKRTKVITSIGHVEVDICDVEGAREGTASGTRYVLCGRDKYSGYVFRFILKDRKEATLVDGLLWIAEEYAENGHKLLSLKSDNEFIGGMMTRVKTALKVETEYSAPYTSNQNGGAERDVRTMQESLRSLMFGADAGYPKTQVGFALRYQEFSQNLCTTIDGISAYQLFTGKRFSFAKLPLIPFGAKVFAKVETHMNNLKNRTFLGYFIAPSIKHSMGAKIFNPSTHQVTTRRSYWVISHPLSAVMVDMKDTAGATDTDSVFNTPAFSNIDPLFTRRQWSEEKRLEQVAQRDATDTLTREERAREVSRVHAQRDATNYTVKIRANLKLMKTVMRLWKKKKATMARFAQKMAEVKDFIRKRVDRKARLGLKGSLKAPAQSNTLQIQETGHKYGTRGASRSVSKGGAVSESQGFGVQAAGGEAGLNGGIVSVRSIKADVEPVKTSGVGEKRKSAESDSSHEAIDEGTEVDPMEVGTEADPKGWMAMMNHPQMHQWVMAIVTEMSTLWGLDFGTVVKGGMRGVPKGAVVLPSNFIFVTKRDAKTGAIDKYKARLTAGGNHQKDLNVTDTFAPTAAASTIMILLAIAASLGYHISAIDITAAFLQEYIDRVTYIRLPKQYAEKGRDVIKLKKSLYGLRQAPRLFQQGLMRFLVGLGFAVSVHDQCLYVKKMLDGSYMYVATHVDDLLVISNSVEANNQLREDLKRKYDGVKFEEEALTFTGKALVWEGSTLLVAQPAYTRKVVSELERLLDFKVADMRRRLCPSGTRRSGIEHIVCEPSVAKRCVGLLQYLVPTRYDILVDVNKMAREMHKPTWGTTEDLKIIAVYLSGTLDSGLRFNHGGCLQIQAHVDASWLSEGISSRTGFGVGFMNGGAMFTAYSKIQKLCALSSQQSEIIALSEACRSVSHFVMLLAELGLKQDTVIVHEDNQAAIAFANHHGELDRTKHIENRDRYGRECVERKICTVTPIPTLDNVADIFTKSLQGELFRKFRDGAMGVAPQVH